MAFGATSMSGGMILSIRPMVALGEFEPGLARLLLGAGGDDHHVGVGADVHLVRADDVAPRA